MKQIVSRDNAHFRALKKNCQSGRERRKNGLILLDGMHLIESFVHRFGFPQEIVFSVSGVQRRENVCFLEKLECASTVTVLADSLFAELTPVESPSGIMAVVSTPCCEHALNHAVDSVVLDGVQDPGNLGSILRSAAAAGFRQVLLSPDCAQVWSPKVLRAGMGAHFLLDIHESCALPEFLSAFRGQAVLTALDASLDLYALNLQAPVAWVFGSEGLGVRTVVAAAVRQRICIPMPGGCESLNVGAAAAICLFETVRQRRTI